jgi:hypothetical protein
MAYPFEKLNDWGLLPSPKSIEAMKFDESAAEAETSPEKQPSVPSPLPLTETVIVPGLEAV